MELYSERTQSNGHKFKYRKFCVDISRKMITKRLVRLETQTVLGNILDYTWR